MIIHDLDRYDYRGQCQSLKVEKVSKVATCTCGCKTREIEEVERDLIWIEVIIAEMIRLHSKTTDRRTRR